VKFLPNPSSAVCYTWYSWSDDCTICLYVVHWCCTS